MKITMADQKQFRFEMDGSACRLELALNPEQLADVAEMIAAILENPNLDTTLKLEGTLRAVTPK